MLVKTILNKVEKFKSFVYGECTFEKIGNKSSIIVDVAARKNARGLCPECHKPSPSYDKQPLRRYQYVPPLEYTCLFCICPETCQLQSTP